MNEVIIDFFEFSYMPFCATLVHMSKIHEHWASRFGFIMATAGSAVGLGSLWRFPYVVGENGGGIFVLLYVIFTLLIGFPVFLGELMIGRKSQKSSILAYVTLGGSSNWKGLGWLNFFTCSIILSYYCVIAGWALSYMIMSINNFSVGKTTEQIQQVFDILYTSGGINLFWFGLYLLLNFAIIVSGIRKGIEHWSRILMPLLFIFLIGIFCYAITLGGFEKAFRFIFYPALAKFTAKSLLSALGMSLFTISVGLGIIVTYGSYMQPHENIFSNGLIITVMTLFVSILSAMTIFPIVFSFGFDPEGGPGLIFKTLPVLFAKLPATLLISTIFFALVLFAALTSTISLFEVLVANLIENFAIKRTAAAITSTVGIFILGIPSALSGSEILFPSWTKIYGKNFFDTMDYLMSNWSMPISALCTTIFIGWFYSGKDAFDGMLAGTNSRWFIWPWYILIKYFAPLVVILIILQESGLIRL